jgi:hypothetical protein
MKPQNKMILDHLKAKGHITPLEALDQYGCFRLASRIHDLRSVAHIQTEMVSENGKTFARYSLVNENLTEH